MASPRGASRTDAASAEHSRRWCRRPGVDEASRRDRDEAPGAARVGRHEGGGDVDDQCARAVLTDGEASVSTEPDDRRVGDDGVRAGVEVRGGG